MRTLTVGAICLVVGLAGGVGGATLAPAFLGGHGGNQPYRDEQGRPITSLSAEDVRKLEAGEGWGLAKPAEFNGYPGPAHVLEWANELALTDAQRAATQASFDAMQAQAKTLGVELIDAEKALDATFVEGEATPDILAARLSAAEDVRAQLRATHLTAHLEVTPILSAAQREKYDELRGYAGHTGH